MDARSVATNSQTNQTFFPVVLWRPLFEVIMQKQAIQVRNLRKCFRKRNGFRKSTELWAVDNVSFSVAQGETYGLLGPNGSGKSSLIRILSTLLIADSGEVKMLGLSLPEQQDEVRWIIGRVSVDAAF